MKIVDISPLEKDLKETLYRVRREIEQLAAMEAAILVMQQELKKLPEQSREWHPDTGLCKAVENEGVVFCPGCGCEVETPFTAFDTKEDANVYALEHCNCAGAKLWRELLHK